MTQRLHFIESERQFEAEALDADGLTLVGFWADWSGACHVMTPVVEAIARAYEGRMRVVLVDIDRLPELGSRFGVESVPALLYFREGRLVDQVLGTAPRRALAEKTDSLLKEGRAE